jgi:hypothetical protein
VWNRRDLLRAAGVSAAAAWLGCGRGDRLGPASPAVDPDLLRAALRDAVAIAATRLREPVAYAQLRRRVRAVVDLVERDVGDELTTAIVIAGRDAAGRWRERAVDRGEPALIREAATRLIADAPAGVSAAVALGAPEDRLATPATDPAALELEAWRDRVESLVRRADAGATSRIIYRAVHVVTDDERTWVVTATRDRSERLVRTRLGATAIAWHGTGPVAGAAEVVGGFGPEPERLTDDALAAVNAEALALTTPGGFAPVAGAEVILAPAIVAALVGPGGARTRGLVAITHEPDLEQAGVPGYASYQLDALGGDGGPRRGGRFARLDARPSNLVVAPGANPGLADDVADGYLLDGVAHVGATGDRIAIRIARARRLAKGRRTGHAWRDVELRGRLDDLLTGARAVGADPLAIAGDDDGPPQAIVAPSLLTRADLGPARGAR